MPIELLSLGRLRIDPTNRLAADNFRAIDRQIMTNYCCQLESQSKESNNLVCIKVVAHFLGLLSFLTQFITKTGQLCNIQRFLSTVKFEHFHQKKKKIF